MKKKKRKKNECKYRRCQWKCHCVYLTYAISPVSIEKKTFIFLLSSLHFLAFELQMKILFFSLAQSVYPGACPFGHLYISSFRYLIFFFTSFARSFNGLVSFSASFASTHVSLKRFATCSSRFMLHCVCHCAIDLRIFILVRSNV